MEKLFIASHNAHKVAEFRLLLAEWGLDVVGLPDGTPDSPETSTQFELIAMEKALHYSRYCDGWVLADDSGLCVPALGGAPGIYSARYAGQHGDDAANREKLLTQMITLDASEREAVFVCAVALWHGRSQVGFTVRGDVCGSILTEEQGQGGFGYDSLFFVPTLGATYAELPIAIKNANSHRAKAVAHLSGLWTGGVSDAVMRGQRYSPASP